MNTESQPERVSIVIPAPNPTGSLHLGHALNLTVQDVFARWHRAQGLPVLWEGATDHGGSSSEIVMHKVLQQQSKVPCDVPEETKRALLSALVNESVRTITGQFRDLRLTLHSAQMRSMADASVQEDFDRFLKTLWDNGYLYWAEKIDQWCYERGQSIPSYDSVQEKSQLFTHTLSYCAGTVGFTVDHTELAYLFDEVGVLVPAASNLARLNGMQVLINPLGKRIGIYAADVPVPRSLVPAYDEESYRFCADRRINVPCSINEHGYFVDGEFKGQDFRKANDGILQSLRQRGVVRNSLRMSLDVRQCRGTGYRIYSRVIPGLFVRSSNLLLSALRNITEGQVSIHPVRYKAMLLPWMEELVSRGEAADWRVSREHLCGNRISADVISAAHLYSDANCLPNYRMDMMISCALWAFTANSIYGPSMTGPVTLKVEKSICVTGLDLLFFWIATIVALAPGIGRPIPFSDVIVHPLVMDRRGRKMSKSEGNTIEISDIIRQFGTPALRLYLLSRVDETCDDLKVDPDALALLANQVTAAIEGSEPDNGKGERISPKQIAEDLSGIEQSMGQRDVGSAARIVSSWVVSIAQWEPLPDDLGSRVQEVLEVFLAEQLSIRRVTS